MCKTNFFFDCRIDIIEEYADKDLKKMSLTFWNLNQKDFVKYIFLKKVKKIIKKIKKKGSDEKCNHAICNPNLC